MLLPTASDGDGRVKAGVRLKSSDRSEDDDDPSVCWELHSSLMEYPLTAKSRGKQEKKKGSRGRREDEERGTDSQSR